MIGEIFHDSGPEAADLFLGARVVDIHRRAQLAAMGKEGGHLGFGEAGDFLNMVHLLRLKEEKSGGPVRCQFLLGEEVRVACGHHAICHQEPGTAMIRVQPVPPPGVMTEDNVGPGLADPVSHLPALVDPGVEFAIRPAEERGLATAAECPGRGSLFFLSYRDEGGEIRVRIPRPLGPVRAHQVVKLAAAGRPFRQRRSAAKLDVIRMGADREGPARYRQVGRGLDGTKPPQTGVDATPRSVGTSTSQLSPDARTIRSGSPSLRLSATCRENDPGP